MAYQKTKFDISSYDLDRLNDAIRKFPGDVEKQINDYLHNTTGKKLIDSATTFIPVSKKGTKHAKFNKWYKQYNYNLAVKIENNNDGKNVTKKTNRNAKKSFYYLYYPATGTGTSRKKGENNFEEKGLKKIENKEINEIIRILNKKSDNFFN